jgi:hypothetical protein
MKVLINERCGHIARYRASTDAMRRYAQTIRATEHPQKHLSIPSATSNSAIFHCGDDLVRCPIEIRWDVNLPAQIAKRQARRPFGQNLTEDFLVLCLG